MNQKNRGVDGEVHFNKFVLILGGNVTGDRLDLQWNFADSSHMLKGDGQLTLSDDGTKFSGQLRLQDGAPLGGGTWTAARTPGAALPEGAGEPAEAGGQGGGDLACDQVGSLKSGDNGPAVTLSFHNRGTSPKQLFWINREGGEVLYATIAPGATLAQQTFETHIWEVKGDSGCELVIKASASDEPVELD
jgi:hypothetical protein